MKAQELRGSDMWVAVGDDEGVNFSIGDNDGRPRFVSREAAERWIAAQDRAPVERLVPRWQEKRIEAERAEQEWQEEQAQRDRPPRI